MIKIEKKLSEDAFYPKSFSKVISNILEFKRVLVHKENIGKVNDFFKKIGIKIDTHSILFFPCYMESLFNNKINPLEFFILNIPRNLIIPFCKIQECMVSSSVYEKSEKNFSITLM